MSTMEAVAEILKSQINPSDIDFAFIDELRDSWKVYKESEDLYQRGLKASKYEEILELFKEASNRDHPLGTVFLHWISRNEDLQEKVQELLPYIKKKCRKCPEMDLFLSLYWCYHCGLGVKKDRKIAEKYFVKVKQFPEGISLMNRLNNCRKSFINKDSENFK